MQRVTNEDGFNVVSLECDGCGERISQVREADVSWFQVAIGPLARDHWNAGEEIGEFHFCSTACFRDRSRELDPSGVLRDRTD